MVGYQPRIIFSFNLPRERIVGKIVRTFLSCAFWRLCGGLSSPARFGSPCSSTTATFHSGTELCLNSSESPEGRESTDDRDSRQITINDNQMVNVSLMFSQTKAVCYGCSDPNSPGPVKKQSVFCFLFSFTLCGFLESKVFKS